MKKANGKGLFITPAYVLAFLAGDFKYEHEEHDDAGETLRIEIPSHYFTNGPIRPVIRNPKSRQIPKSVRYYILKDQSYTCQHCGVSSPHSRLEIDHIKPFSKGGLTEYDNLQVLCYDCNRGKGASE